MWKNNKWNWTNLKEYANFNGNRLSFVVEIFYNVTEKAIMLFKEQKVTKQVFKGNDNDKSNSPNPKFC